MRFIRLSPGQRFCEAVVFERKRGWPTIRAGKKEGKLPQSHKNENNREKKGERCCR